MSRAQFSLDPAQVPEPPVPRAPRDARRFWRISLALLAPIPWLAKAVYDVVVPAPLAGDLEDSLAAVAAHPTAAAAADWVDLVFLLGLVPATLAVLWACRRAAPRLTLVGGLLTVVGFSVGPAALPGGGSEPLQAAVRAGFDPAAIVALDEKLWGHPTAGVAIALFLLGGVMVGLLLLGLALWRGRVAPTWMAVALMLGGPTHPFLPGNLATAAGMVLVAIGYAGASVALIRMRDDDFDLPPLPQITRS